MRVVIDLEKKERERHARRKFVQNGFMVIAVISCGFLLWKLKAMLLPIVVGALHRTCKR